MFDFESSCVQEQTFKDTKTTNWMRKHLPKTLSLSSNLVDEPVLLCNSDPHHPVASFIGCGEVLTLQSNSQTIFFPDIGTTIKIKLGSIFNKLTQCHNRRDQATLNDCDNESCASTQFSKIQKNQLIELQKHFKRYCNASPVFGFNRAKTDLDLIKSFLLPLFRNEILNLQSPRKRTSLSRSVLLILS